MFRGSLRAIAGSILGIVGSTVPQVTLEGQEHLTVRADVMLYGDNTEFRNPFREGETLFGAALRPTLDVTVNRRVVVTLGALANQRFGSEDAFELVRPVIAVTFHGARSTFRMGTLPWTATSGPSPGGVPNSGQPATVGPDHGGPHGLLPPLQRETLTFERPYEAGLQWTMSVRPWRHEAWINWQRLNTPAHRERFDAGFTGEALVGDKLSVPIQFHAVHEGGQLFAAGPVADSLAAAAGVRVSKKILDAWETSIEGYGLVSRYVPDREAPFAARNGAGMLGRIAAARARWRGHLLFWRGDDFVKDEGDPNYLSIRRDGSRYRGIRDYAEVGLTRSFAPVPHITFEASGRVHRIEKQYEYSYRLLCVARLDWQIN